MTEKNSSGYFCIADSADEDLSQQVVEIISKTNITDNYKTKMQNTIAALVDGAVSEKDVLELAPLLKRMMGGCHIIRNEQKPIISKYLDSIAVPTDRVLDALKAVIEGGFTEGVYSHMEDSVLVASGDKEPHGGVSREDRQVSLKRNIYALLTQTQEQNGRDDRTPARELLRRVADGLDVDLYPSVATTAVEVAELT